MPEEHHPRTHALQLTTVVPGTEIPAPNGDVSKCTMTCPDGSTVPLNEPDKCPTPVITCVDLVLIQSPDWNQRTVRLSTRIPSGSEISKVSFLLDNKSVGSKNNPGEKEEFTYNRPNGRKSYLLSGVRRKEG
jgi:hypothetical protein